MSYAMAWEASRWPRYWQRIPVKAMRGQIDRLSHLDQFADILDACEPFAQIGDWFRRWRALVG